MDSGIWRLMKTEIFLIGIAVVFVAGLVAVLALVGTEFCPPNQTYQVVKYEPQFSGNKMPVYKPIYGCK